MISTHPRSSRPRSPPGSARSTRGAGTPFTWGHDMALTLTYETVARSATSGNTWLQVSVPAGCAGVLLSSPVALYYQRSGAGLADGSPWAAGASEGMPVPTAALPVFVQIAPAGSATAIYVSTGASASTITADPVPLGVLS